jgi:osmotically-inducible protein OsmY
MSASVIFGRPAVSIGEVESDDFLPTIPIALQQGFEAFQLAQQVRDVLRATGHGCLRAVEVTIDGQMVVLRGTLPSYYLKQLSQEAVLNVSGVKQIRNEIAVNG